MACAVPNVPKEQNETVVNFCRIFQSWEQERLGTIEKLHHLLDSLHKAQTLFNKSNIFIKELNINSRQYKMRSGSFPIAFLASVTTLATDAASSLASLFQAFNADSYMEAFRYIMTNDAEMTRPLYSARSLCLDEYRGVEEVVRNVRLRTFENTMVDISDVLRLDKLMQDMSSSSGVNDAVACLDRFIKRSSEERVMSRVSDSVSLYTRSNPALLQAFQSVGKTFYDIYGILYSDSATAIAVNNMLMFQERQEVSRLRSLTNNEETQAKLECDISVAIAFLEAEVREMKMDFEAISAND